jgi:hypothetical protein
MFITLTKTQQLIDDYGCTEKPLQALILRYTPLIVLARDLTIPACSAANKY